MRTPRSKAALACSAVASLCPSETVTPRSSSRVDQRVGAGQLGRERHQPDRPAVEQPVEQGEVGVAARRGPVRAEPPRREERALEVHAEDARARRASVGTSRSAASSCSSGEVISVGR